MMPWTIQNIRSEPHEIHTNTQMNNFVAFERSCIDHTRRAGSPQIFYSIAIHLQIHMKVSENEMTVGVLFNNTEQFSLAFESFFGFFCQFQPKPKANLFSRIYKFSL